MIQEILNSIFINAEFIGLYTDLSQLATDSNPVKLKIDAPLNGLKLAVTDTNALYLQQRTSQETENIFNLDEIRDRYFTGFKKVVDGYAYHYDAVVVKAATTLQLCINKYGENLIRKSYVAETTALSSMADDFENDDDVAAALVTLKIDDWAAQIKIANINFNKAYLVRTSEYAERVPGDLLPFKNAIMEKFDTLKRHIEANQLLTPSDDYVTLISKMNSLITQYHTVARRRRANGGEPTAEEPVNA